MPSSRLANRVALITGSSSGLGRAIALAYASEGAKVCCVDLYSNLRNAVNPSTGKADSIHNRIDTGVSTSELLNQRYGSGSACFVQADCTSAPNIEKAVRNCVLHFGRLDILVNNAGISVESTHERVMRIHDTSEEDYDKTMSINTKGVFLGCKYGLRQMLEQEPLPEFGGTRGWIVNTASVQAFAAYYGTRELFLCTPVSAPLCQNVGCNMGL